MSDEYIKREDAKDAVINVVGWESIARYVDEMSKHFCTKDNDYYDALMDAEDAIDDIPSADVAPFNHGHWIKHEGRNGAKDSIECSACGVWIDDMPRKTFCPNCGARMDKGGDD